MTNREKFTILTLLRIGGVENRIKELLQDTFSITISHYPSLSEKQIKQLKEEFGSEKYLEELAQLFHDNFSQEELDQIKEFWSSPAGRKLNVGSLAESERELSLNWIIKLRNRISSFEQLGKENE